MIQITANKDLFDAWKLIGQRIGNLGAIVQNTMELSEEDLIEWAQIFDACQQDLDALLTQTGEHLTGRDDDDGSADPA
jgi:hypothetical protein